MRLYAFTGLSTGRKTAKNEPVSIFPNTYTPACTPLFNIFPLIASMICVQKQRSYSDESTVLLSMNNGGNFNMYNSCSIQIWGDMYTLYAIVQI